MSILNRSSLKLDSPPSPQVGSLDDMRDGDDTAGVGSNALARVQRLVEMLAAQEEMRQQYDDQLKKQVSDPLTLTLQLQR